jgi:hypothetical protein
MVAAKKLFGTFLCNSLWFMALMPGVGLNTGVFALFRPARSKDSTGRFSERRTPGKGQ